MIALISGMGLGTSYNNIINYNLQHSTIHCKNEYNNTIYTELREQVHVTSNQNNIIPFVTTYNPRDYNIFHFMKQIEFNLKGSERMNNVLQKKEDYKQQKAAEKS